MARCPVMTSSHPRRTTTDVERGEGHRPAHAQAPGDPVALGAARVRRHRRDGRPVHDARRVASERASSGDPPSTDGGQSWTTGSGYFQLAAALHRGVRVGTCARCNAAASSPICWAFDIAAGRYLSKSGDGVTRRRAHLVGTHRHGAPGRIREPHVPGRRAIAQHPTVTAAPTSGWSFASSTSPAIAGRRSQNARSGRLDATADARRADVLRVRRRDPVRQGSLLRSRSGDILATHWCVVDGQGRVLTHRLRITPD